MLLVKVIDENDHSFCYGLHIRTKCLMENLDQFAQNLARLRRC